MTEFRPGSVDYERQAPFYQQARALSADATQTWRAVAEQWLAPLSPSRVLDLGSGTGRLSALLADWLSCKVVGVEPSVGMRATAGRENSHESVTYLEGEGAHIPLPDASCDGAWMLHVVHHVTDRRVCAREISRVLRPGGRLLIMGAYSQRRHELAIFDYFPASRRIIDGFPLTAEIIADFQAEGLGHLVTEEKEYISTASIAASVERARLRADTLLQLITDDEFAEGMARLEAAAAAETVPQPIIARADLIAFER